MATGKKIASGRSTGKAERACTPDQLQALAYAAAVAEVDRILATNPRRTEAERRLTWTETDTEMLRRAVGEPARTRPHRFTYRGEDREVLANYAALAIGWWSDGPLTDRTLALMSILVGIPDWTKLCARAERDELDPSAADAINEERRKMKRYARVVEPGRIFDIGKLRTVR